MLIVSLCGAFPFDHTRAHEGFTDDQELDLWWVSLNAPHADVSDELVSAAPVALQNAPLRRRQEGTATLPFLEGPIMLWIVSVHLES